MKRLISALLVLLMLCGFCGAFSEDTAGDAFAAQEESSVPETELPEEEAEEELVSENLLPFETLSYGSQGTAVTAVQEQLTALGYYTGKISGNYLEGTRAGIRSFQKDYGLKETGAVDEETYGALMAAEYRPLQNGDNGVAVTRLQERLIALGYLSMKATGKFRGATETAVKAFQAAHDLPVTGEADPDTQRALFGANALAKGASPTPTPDPDEDFGDLNDIVITGDGEAVDTVAYEKKLSRGAKGENVKQVQNRLKELGFFNGPVSGNYMNQTVAAVKLFQEYNAIGITGVTDEATWNAMFNDAQVVTAECTPRPTPEPTPIPYAVTVDVRNQAVLVFGRDDNGEYTVPVKYFLCSTGMKATPSDVGEWVLNGAKARWCYFPKWGSNAQYWTRINSGIAFHSLIYNADSSGQMHLSLKSYKKLGQRASHGCVRLFVSDAKWIYDNVGAGTVVTITEKRPSDEELRKAIAKPALNRSKTGPVTTPAPTPFPSYSSTEMPPQPFRKLSKGDSGEDVYWLQAKLKDLGYYEGTLTGSFYSGTQKAVKKFQKANGMRTSGVAEIAMQEKLFEDVLVTPEITLSDAPDAAPEPTPVPR